ncbi:MAG: hypothetical protein D6693_08740 [Planctomycetota bacterium]|nr:MAG: hypothetical protein D6693_08740 [Planctomycetota bacterium]
MHTRRGSFTMLALAAGLSAPAAAATPDAPSADEIRALVADMLADAQTRSSLLQTGATAGHDGGFFLASADGSFRLNISGQIQARYTLNFRDEGNPPVNDDFESGFTNPRTVLRFDGNIYDKFIYGIQGIFMRSGGGFTLEDAYAGYVSDSGLIFIVGQYREPILWEDVLNDKYSLAVDQSVVNAVFAQGFSQGAWVHYQADTWRFWAGVNDGIRSANSDLGADPADIGFTTRWEYKIGDATWDQFGSFSSPRGSAYGVKLGGGVHYELGPHVPGPLPPAGIGTNETYLLAYTGDVMVQGDGWNVFAMGVGLQGEGNGGTPSTSDFGVLVQGGVFVTDQLEPFVRWDAVIPDNSRTGSSVFNTLTFGANYYIHGQAAKVTLDVQYFVDSVSSNGLVAATATGAAGTPATRIGLLPTTDDGHFAVRLQFQLLF